MPCIAGSRRRAAIGCCSPTPMCTSLPAQCAVPSRIASSAGCGVANGRGLMGLHFYRSVMEMARGAEKTVYVVFRFNLLWLISITLIFLILELAAFGGLMLLGRSWIGTAAAIGAALAVG